MRYLALAVDYDGTIATNGKVNKATLTALQRITATGRKLILVTGRELDDLQGVFKHIDIFDCVVAENGALLYNPKTRAEQLLGEAPPEEFVAELKRRKVKKLSVGRSIVATWEPHQTTVLETINDLGLDRQIIFNKGAVMILPASINKETGLRAALAEMDLSPHNVVGVGDAENDQAFLNICETSAAVANALPSVRKRVDIVLDGERGAGVVELIKMLLDDDELAGATKKLTRHDVLLGQSDDKAVTLAPYGTSILVAGPSGSGKSTATTGFMERLAEANYQFCLIDPEGDYENFAGAVTVGNSRLAPNVEEIMQLLQKPDGNVVVNLLGIALEDRPSFFAGFLPRLMELRVKTGRPHWIIVDEAHHLLPASWSPAASEVPQEFSQMLLITVHPDWVAPSILQCVNTVIAVGEGANNTFAGFAKPVKAKAPKLTDTKLKPGEIYLWRRGSRIKPQKVMVEPAQAERRRHRRKYAEGDIVEHEHFYFRGPKDELNLRANNLISFMQMGEGVDDETWDFHLRRGDFSNWFRYVIKDNELADVADKIASQKNLSPKKTRAAVRKEIEERYTLPA